MSTPAYPVPVPDRDPSEATTYVHHGDDATAWGWEFLRRNGEYQAAWDEFDSYPDAFPDGSDNGKWPQNTLPVGLRFGVDGFCCKAIPPAEGGWTVDDYLSRVGLDGRIVSFVEFFEERFRLHPEPIDWRSADIGSSFFTASFSGNGPLPWSMTEHVHRSGNPGAWLNEPMQRARDEIGVGLELFVFDAGAAIGPQVARLQRRLEQRKQTLLDDGWIDGVTDTTPHFRPDQGVRYLRILDGLAAGLDDRELRTAIGLGGSGKSKQYQGAKAAALALREDGYWRIATT